MKYVLILLAILIIPLFSNVYGADGIPPLTQLQKEIREDGYSIRTITSILVLVISGIIASLLFFRKDIKGWFINRQ